MAGRENFKSWKMGLPGDSQAWQDLLDYGRELGMQPAETARVIIVEWSQARHGHLALGGSVSHIASTPMLASVKPKESTRDRAKAKGARHAATLGLDDDE